MVKAVLLDIEGTIAPLSFVKEVMFPYSKRKLREFLEENWDKPVIQEIIRDASREVGKELNLEEAVETFSRWIDEDRKITPLKELQGYIWEEGFKSGELRAPLYEDAYKKIKEWNEKGVPVYIYSSGSVKAQELFFSHTEYGNILNLFSGFFDTKIGSKKEKESYLRIAEKIGLNPEEILFVSDNPDELRVARKAGFKVLQSVREDVQPSEEFKKIYSFEEIEL